MCVSHPSGTAALRNAVHLEEQRQPELLGRPRAAGLGEAIYLSTCDRSEVQAVAEVSDLAAAAAENAFTAQASVPRPKVRVRSYRLAGTGALRQSSSCANCLA